MRLYFQNNDFTGEPRRETTDCTDFTDTEGKAHSAEFHQGEEIHRKDLVLLPLILICAICEIGGFKFSV
jgi:hypothetical protein